MINTQFSKVGRTYPKMEKDQLDTKTSRERILFSMQNENKTVQTVKDSKVIRLNSK